MKIVDCVMVTNEIDWVRARIAEHIKWVNKIYIVEATRTHNNKSRDLVFNKTDIDSDPKVEYIILDGKKYFSTPNKDLAGNKRPTQRLHRHFVKDILNVHADWYCCLDADEIIYREFWPRLLDFLANTQNKRIKVPLHWFQYSLDNKLRKPFLTHNFYRRDFVGFKKGENQDNNFETISGVHLQYMGGYKEIKNKLKNTHNEYKHLITDKYILNKLRYKKGMFKSGRIKNEKVNPKKYMPKYILENWNYYEKYII